MSKHMTKAQVFALRGWTIRTENGKFFISPTAHFDDKPSWKGPYKSLQHATTAIARKLEAEFTERHARLNGKRSKVGITRRPQVSARLQ